MGLLAKLIYKKLIIRRYDDNHITHYFTYDEFLNLQATPIEFKTPQNNLLRGNIYYYPDYKKDYIVIFCHGIGGGHRSYMREIEKLCKEGFQVVGFDYTGCFASEGKNIRGLTESINSLNSCLLYLEKEKLLENKKVVLVGHSWGGYAVSNIQNFYQGPIDTIINISGFSEYKKFMHSTQKGFVKSLIESCYKYEKEVNNKYADSCSLDALNKTTSKVLMIHSIDDPIVPYKDSTGFIKENCKNPNVEYLIFENKKHNPNYLDDARLYMTECFSKYNTLVRKRKLKTLQEKKNYQDSWDYIRMTNQDDEVWKRIFETIMKEK